MMDGSFTVESRDLSRALASVSRAIERSNSIPILGMARLRVEGGRATVFGTNMDNDLSVVVRTNDLNGTMMDSLISDPGRIGRMAGRLDGPIQVTRTGDKVTAGLSLETGDCRIQTASGGIPSEDMPTLPAMEATFSATLGADAIAALLRVRPAISTEETRYYLNGVFFAAGIGAWAHSACATDGHRMFVQDVALPDAAGALPLNGKSGRRGIIIPHGTLKLLAGLAKPGEPVAFRAGHPLRRNSPDAGGQLAVDRTGAPFVEFSSASFTLRGKVVDGEFPNYEPIIPKDFSFRALIDRSALLKALGFLSEMASRSSPAASLEFSNASLLLSTRNVGLGASSDVRLAAEHAGQFRAEVNIRYLTEALKAARGERLVFEANDADAPIKLTGQGDGAFFSILMPTRM